MKARPGVTLLEVLVAIFVMAIGMMALLVLFPIGALRMHQAIQDDRAAHAALNASALAEMRNVRHDTTIQAVYTNPNLAGTPPALRVPNAGPDEPSYPVFVDPHGWINATAAPQTTRAWVGGARGGIPRRTVSFVGANTANAYRWFSVLDDVYFDANGSPRVVTSPPAAARFERDYHYTFALLCQRPRTDEPSVINLSVVVYRRRAMSRSDLYETVYSGPSTPVGYDTSRNVITIKHNGAPPKVRAGDWLLDATPIIGAVKVRHAFFYRVQSVTDISGTMTEYEVQTPLRGFPSATPPPPAAGDPPGYPGVVIAMDGIIEVLERGAGWRPE